MTPIEGLTGAQLAALPGFKGALMALGVGSRQYGNIGTCIKQGRIANTSYSAEGTYEMLFEVPYDFDAIRPIFAWGNTVPPSVTQTIVRCPADTTDAASNAAPRFVCTYSGSNAQTPVASASATRRNYQVGDWAAVHSVPRTDGGSGRLVIFRCHVAAGAMTVWGDGSQSMTNWASKTNGRAFRSRFVASATDYSASGNWAGFAGAGATLNSGNPIVGYQALSRGKVINVFGFGDSRIEGQGTYVGEGYGLPACIALSAAQTNVVYEWSDLGWSGQAIANTLNHVNDAIAQGMIPDVAMLQAGTPNGNVAGSQAATGTPLTDAIVNGDNASANYGERGYFGLMQIALAAKAVPIVVSTWEPCNTSQRVWAASDSLRRAYNTDIRNRAGAGVTVLDVDALVAGVDDGSGQIQIRAGLSSDNIHLNDTGNAVVVPAAQRAIAFAAWGAAGLLAAA